MEELLKEILESLKSERPQKITFSIQEAALYLGIGHEKVRELVEKPNTDFPYFKVGARTSIDKRALDRWLEKITEEHRIL
ncbi:helix-turn-helix domain-containing protein [Clostridium beijerinckii]|uniref:helix-turn-helix domain-containing protein n=1 Tax=Clostridium beijerinckii TaxID=1520 RepID=UPI0013611D8C|nr:helix-turn-helix domain-containing protein [Clostridium beijerinckii]MZK53504.1 helix-turn-helix domain-containing protein [Clostridium beijerinckii]MZK61642.1 helix-turn-helix domain-containing protein [Clostridium beijerinckii]MZK71867.1 helix-turn-helix domain-containing protein [Clostridium beijerinckii]MZK77271.1 helix-turn-helix domain-containing protein [Clostridium beijerinckii]MZK86350.1 helix-turn-helix domain-containing protein [Clostridium beijerinckii]